MRKGVLFAKIGPTNGCLSTYLAKFFVFRINTGVKCDQVLLSYRSMHQDVRASMDYLHECVCVF